MATQGKRRALGQHFLRDRTVCEKIVETTLTLAQETGCASLLEIGPGQGALTEILLARSPLPVTLAERDPELVDRWEAHRADYAQKPFGIEPGDFMDLPEARWLGQPPLGVMSNLPYSAGTAILTRLARHPEKIPFMVLMFQAEVAQRVRAEPDSRAWGSLSVWIQNCWDVTKLVSVPPRAFSPPPQVDSEVVILRARDAPRIPLADEAAEKAWEGLLKACFAHRRKMLRSGLRGSDRAKNALDASGVDGTKRAESLSWDEWARLYAALGSSRA